MSKKMLMVGMILLSLLLLSCACNLGDYFGNIFNRVQEELGDSVEIDGTVSLEESQEELPEMLETNPPEPEAVLTEEVTGVIPAAWLVISTKNGLWVMDDQGNDFHSVYSGQYLTQSSAAPNGGLVAFIQAETEYSEGQLTLGLVNLADEHYTMVSALTNDETAFSDNGEMNVGDEAREANMAMMFDNLVWSPDGQYLAFIGAQSEQFAALYALDVETGTVRRLIGAESHLYQPVWSPDSQYVLAPSATTFGTGAGFAMDAMWIARPDGSEGQPLFDASSSIDQEVWGWMDAQTMLFSPIDIVAGYKHLQLMDINTGAVQEVIGASDYFYDADLSPSAGTVMFSFPFDDMLEWVEDETITERGLYLFRSDTGSVEQISDAVDYGSWVVWDQQTQCYYAYLSLPVGGASGYMEVYNAWGEIDGSCPMLPLGVSNVPRFSATGDYYSWKNESWSNPENNRFFVGNTANGDSVTVQSGTVSFFVWHPTEDTVFFVQDSMIYKATAPDFVPVVIAEADETIENFYWAMP